VSDTLRTLAVLVQRGEVLISAHGYDELAEDGILAVEAIDGVSDAVAVEDYPDYSKGPVRRHTKLVREGQYAAEVDVELIEAENGWSPYLALDDARKLDVVREALRRGDIPGASRHARVYSLTPISW
jgi:hypothetical protein